MISLFFLVSILLFTSVFFYPCTSVCLSLLVLPLPLPFSYYCISIFATGCQASLQPCGFVALSVTFSSLGSSVHLVLFPIAWCIFLCVSSSLCVCECVSARCVSPMCVSVLQLTLCLSVDRQPTVAAAKDTAPSLLPSLLLSVSSSLLFQLKG